MPSIIYGINPVKEVLLNASVRAEMMAVVEGRAGPHLMELKQLARDKGVIVEQKSRKQLDDLTEGGRHQGVVIFAKEREALSLQELIAATKGLGDPVLIILDGVTDPRNLGAVIRAAEVLGGNGIIIGKNRSATLTPAAVKASAGASEILPVVKVVNISQSLKLLKESGFWVIGTDARAKRKCFEYDWRGPRAVVMGSEGKGMRRLVRDYCDEVLSIPVRGKVTSLNVASAVAIIMYEIARQRGAIKEKKGDN